MGRAEGWRKDFPILFTTVREGLPLVYLDNAATTQKPERVIACMNEYYHRMNANVHRGIHRLAELATEEYEATRGKVARWVKAPNEGAVIFTRGTTESINLVAHGWGRKFVKEGDELLITEMEHHSNLVPWQMLAAATGAVLRYVPVQQNGELDLAAFHERLTPRTKLLAVTHMSNVLGTINPVKAMAEAARRVGAVTLVDGAQSVPHMPIDFEELGCDFFAFSGHKMAGPTGIGILVAKPELLEAMDPFLGGGEMISKVSFERSTWAEVPHKFEAGTPNIAGAIGLGAAIDYLGGLDGNAVRAYEEALTAYALERLQSVEGLSVVGLAAHRGGAISFSMEGVHPHDVAHFVDQDGIAVRAGHMCAQPLVKKFGHSALTRASLYFYNLPLDVDGLIESLNRVREYFHRGS
ncbi:MAG TPA: cysteine desulfurase [Kiritimatiellia bacterium]|nr:cysteine desulfurase [Kiritimatiellia bacterium]